jgi:hypothetical protein
VTGGPDRAAARQIDLSGLRQFFLGVLGWTPQALRRAGLHDLCAACAGFRRHRRPPGAQTRVSKSFMAEMLRRFPDGE